MRKLRIFLLIIVVFALGAAFSACNKGITDDTNLIDRGLTVKIRYDFQGGVFDTQNEMLIYHAPNAPYVNPEQANRKPLLDMYYIEGWYKSIEQAPLGQPAEVGSFNAFTIYSDKINFDTDRVSTDITLYAKWMRKPYFLITYVADDGNDVVIKKAEAERGEPYAQFGTEGREGFTFVGYYKDKGLTIPWQSTDVFDAAGNDQTIYTKWIKGSYKLVYKPADFLEGGPHYYLMNDIDFSETAWTSFSLVDGSIVSEGGFKIKNITINSALSSGGNTTAYALFNGVVNSTIDNVVFDNIKINVDYTYQLWRLRASIITVEILGNSVIKNCTITNTCKLTIKNMPNRIDHRVGAFFADDNTSGQLVYENNTVDASWLDNQSGFPDGDITIY